jgi:hypothetical protein
MSPRPERELPDDLRIVEERLRRGRADASSLELDRLKRRALAQAAAHERPPSLISSRIAAVVTALALLAGAGGAVALSGLDRHPNTQGGAANRQYHHHKYCTHGNPPPGKKCKGVSPGSGSYGHKHHQRHHHKKHHHHHNKHHSW